MIEVEGGHDVVVNFKENKRDISVNPLRVLLAEEKDFKKGNVGSFMIREGKDGKAKEEREDVESWRYNCLAKFYHCLGMPAKGFEGEILKLLNRMKEKRREQFERVSGKKRKGERSFIFDQELKKLEYSVNYGGLGEDRGQ